jgi:undecaprenyl pyrophosphate phosphatase UppP
MFIPFGGACLTLFLLATALTTTAFILDVVDKERNHVKAATGLFTTGYVLALVTSVLTLVCFVMFFNSGVTI